MRGKVLIGLGVVCLLIGTVWTLQGVGIITGSFMTNSRTWLVIGLLVGIAGIYMLFEATRRRRS